MIRISGLLMAVLFSLSLNAQVCWTYLSPQPGSRMINPENTIAFRQGEPVDWNSVSTELITVAGSQSGMISGKWVLSSDSRTLIFRPDYKYRYNETISVQLQSGIKTESGKIIEGCSFEFRVRDNIAPLRLGDNAKEIPQEKAAMQRNKRPEQEVLYSYKNRISYGADVLPDNFPPAEILVYNNPAPGLAFYASEPETSQYGEYAVILDNYGTPVFFREWSIKPVNFQVAGNNQLMHKHKEEDHDFPNCFLVLDDKYNPTDTLRVGNGYETNTHDGILLANGNHYLMIYDSHLVGMDTVVPGGNPNATVTGFVLQELDADHNVIFQWRSWDHFDITDANHVDLTKPIVDYVHVNSFDTTADGNILLCCRHFDEITKIDRNTGDIIWRFGPKAQQNMFTFSNDTMGFTWPHDIQQLENGHLTLYDNGNFHVPPFSRGMEYEIDEENLTATLVWEYANDPLTFCKNKGSARRLPNTNTLIGWGNSWPVIATETAMDGTKTWELSVDSTLSYRVFKFDWQTSYFETNFDTIDYGYWDDYVAWPVIFTVTNNVDHEITISSASNHLPVFYLGTPLPLSIPAGGSENMILYFFPENMPDQNFDDVLTLNYDSFYADTLPQRISRQIVLKGTTIEPLSVSDQQIAPVSVYPNPTHGVVKLSASQGQIEEINVFDALGQMVLKENAGLKAQYKLDISQLNNGMYFIQVLLSGSHEPTLIKVVKN